MAVIADWFGGYTQGEREASAQYLDELASIRAQRAADLDYTMTVLEPAMTYDRDQRAFQQRMDEMDRRSALAREEDARARALGAWWTGEWEHPFIDAVAQEAYGDLLTQYGPPQRTGPRPGQTQTGPTPGLPAYQGTGTPMPAPVTAPTPAPAAPSVPAVYSPPAGPTARPQVRQELADFVSQAAATGVASTVAAGGLTPYAQPAAPAAPFASPQTAAQARANQQARRAYEELLANTRGRVSRAYDWSRPDVQQDVWQELMRTRGGL